MSDTAASSLLNKRALVIGLAVVVIISLAAVIFLLAQSNRSTVKVPNVVGMSQAVAKQALTTDGLTWRVVSLGGGPAHPSPPGTVVAEIPTAGSSVSSGSKVQLNVYLATQ